MSANVKLRAEFPTSKVLWSVFGWLVVFVFFFPVLWMWLESLKTEPQAASSPAGGHHDGNISGRSEY